MLLNPIYLLADFIGVKKYKFNEKSETDYFEDRKTRVIKLSNVSWHIVWADEYDNYMKYYAEKKIIGCINGE